MGKHIKVEHLFGNHKFWENTKNKFNLPSGSLLGSILKKWNMVVVNLSDLWYYCLESNNKFEDIYSKTIAHEIFHINMMEEKSIDEKIDGEKEDMVISKIIKIKEKV